MTFIDQIKRKNNEIVLSHLGSPAPEMLITDKECISLAFLDVETTGLDKRNDQIIELAVKVVNVEKTSGKIVSIESEYESYNDPGFEISDRITQLTGIKNKDIKERAIAWGYVDDLISNVDLIVAHNATFDRSFVDRNSVISVKKVWSCSVNDIDWLKRGFSSSKQELLCYWHGFFFDAHRAMNDIDALINLLTHSSYSSNRPIKELIQNSQKVQYIILAENFSYNEKKKEIIKRNKYMWNPDQKVWYKNVLEDSIEAEKKILAAAIYDNVFQGRVKKIDPIDKYKPI